MKQRSPVSLIQNEDAGDATRRALESIGDEIRVSIKEWEKRTGGNRVLIKPNLLSTNENFECNTSVVVAHAIADFFTELGGYEIHVGDGTTWEKGHHPSTMVALKNHGYAVYHDWHLADLHDGSPGAWFEVVNHEPPTGQVELGVSELATGSYVVSVAKFKTHDVLGLTLSMKNMMGTLMAARIIGSHEPFMKGDVKGWMHGLGNKKPHQLTRDQNIGTSKVALAANIVRLARCRMPDLAVIDGSTVMEGHGPRRGHTCQSLGNIVLAGTDPVAVDATCARLASIELERVPYISLAEECMLGTALPSEIRAGGRNWQDFITRIEVHPLFPASSPWKGNELVMARNYLGLP